MISAEQGAPGQRKVADGVQHLVADALVGEARALRVENAVVADDEGVLERGTQRVTRVPQGRDVAHEAEGARARELAAECLGFQIDRESLASDQRMIELDL